MCAERGASVTAGITTFASSFGVRTSKLASVSTLRRIDLNRRAACIDLGHRRRRRVGQRRVVLVEPGRIGDQRLQQRRSGLVAVEQGIGLDLGLAERIGNVLKIILLRLENGGAGRLAFRILLVRQHPRDAGR